MADAFISYSRKDQQFVLRLVELLGARGKECWVDWNDIPPTAEFMREIYEGIELSDAFLFVITPDSARSAVCCDEIGYAAKHHKRIIPLLLREPDGTPLPAAVASLNWVLFSESDDLNIAVDRLVDVMGQDLEHVRQHTRWLHKALEWSGGDRDSSLLLRGSELRAAEDWIASAGERQPTPTPMQYEYLQASRAAATKRQRLVVAALGAGLVIAAILAMLALIQRSQAIEARKVAQSRFLASEALSLMKRQVDTGVLLALAAYRVKPTTDARDSVSVAMRRSARLIGVFGNGSEAPAVVRFTPDGALVAAGFGDGTILVWDRIHRRRLARLKAGPGAIQSLSFSASGNRLAALAHNGSVALWRLDRRTRFERIATAGLRADAVAFSGTTDSLVLGTHDGLETWRPGHPPQQLIRLERSPVTKLAVGTGGSIAAGSAVGVTVVSSGVSPGALRVGGGDVVQDLTFDATGRRLALVAGEQAYLWTRANGLRRVEAGRTEAIGLAQGGLVVTGGYDGDVTVWHSADTRGSPVAPVRTLRLGESEVLSLDAHDGVVAAGSLDGRIALWNLARSDLQRAVSTRLHVLDDLVVVGAHTVLAGGEGHVVEEDLDSGTTHVLLDPPGGPITLAASRDARTLAAGGSDSQTVVVWSAPAGRSRPRTLRWHDDRPIALAFWREGSVIEATQSTQGTLDLWRPGSGRPLTIRVGRQVNTLAAAQSEDRIAVGAYDGAVFLTDVDSDHVERLGQVGGVVNAVAFAPDGARVVAAGSDATVTLWRTGSRSREVLPAGSAPLTDVAFDPRGQTIAAGDAAGDVFLWDARGGTPLGPPLELGRQIVSVGFDPSGRTLVVGLQNGLLVLYGQALWNAADAIESLCGKIGRPLSRSERTAYDVPPEASADVCS